jgi:transcription termination/antitermination protein NusG
MGSAGEPITRLIPLVEPGALTPDQDEPGWYAVYTRAQHEKRVAEQMKAHAIEGFLPLYEAVHRWKDRRKRVELALFPSYVFARLALRNRLELLRIPGVVRLVGFNGRPAPLAESEIESLRRALIAGVCAEPHPYLRAGHRVRITAGPLTGREGILTHWKGKLRVVLSMEVIQRSISVDIDASSVVPVSGRGSCQAGSPLRAVRFSDRHHNQHR